MESDRHYFSSFWVIFCPVHYWCQKLKFWKNLKKLTLYIILLHMCNHKWRSYDVWLLTYKAWWVTFFVILHHFLTFDSTNDLKNQNFEKMKSVEIWSRCIKNHDHMLYYPWVWLRTDVIVIFHFGLFFALLPY